MKYIQWLYHNQWFIYHYRNVMNKKDIEHNYIRMIYHHEKLLKIEGEQ